jgi:hypothetical protein
MPTSSNICKFTSRSTVRGLIRAEAMYTCNYRHGEASTALDLASQLGAGGLAPAPKRALWNGHFPNSQIGRISSYYLELPSSTISLILI